MYHDTVGKGNTDPSTKVEGDNLTDITATGFFNDVAEVLQEPGGVIIITAKDSAGMYKVTQVFEDGKPAVTVEAM